MIDKPTQSDFHYRFNPPLMPVRLLKRYKRFLADVEGDQFQNPLTVHCANPGGMQGLVEPQGAAWISDSCNPKRKLRYSLELVYLQSGAWVCVNTNLANKVVYEALKRQDLLFLPNQQIQAESTWISREGEKTRFDFKLSSLRGETLYLEVKSVTYLLEQSHAAFPDAQTKRGQKHLRHLIEVVERGDQACLLFLINRTGISQMSPAWKIDPIYARLLYEAQEKGVQVVAYTTQISPEGITLGSLCPIHIHATPPNPN